MSSLTIYNTHTHTLKLVAVSSHESLLGFIPAVTRQSSPQESQDDPDALCSAGKHHWFLLPATEFGRGIIRLDEFCVGYWMGPSDPTAPEVFLAVETLRTPVPDVDASSSATGEHVSGRTCWAQLLILPFYPLQTGAAAVVVADLSWRAGDGGWTRGNCNWHCVHIWFL